MFHRIRWRLDRETECLIECLIVHQFFATLEEQSRQLFIRIRSDFAQTSHDNKGRPASESDQSLSNSDPAMSIARLLDGPAFRRMRRHRHSYSQCQLSSLCSKEITVIHSCGFAVQVYAVISLSLLVFALADPSGFQRLIDWLFRNDGDGGGDDDDGGDGGILVPIVVPGDPRV